MPVPTIREDRFVFTETRNCCLSKRSKMFNVIKVRRRDILSPMTSPNFAKLKQDKRIMTKFSR